MKRKGLGLACVAAGLLMAGTGFGAFDGAVSVHAILTDAIVRAWRGHDDAPPVETTNGVATATSSASPRSPVASSSTGVAALRTVAPSPAATTASATGVRNDDPPSAGTWRPVISVAGTERHGSQAPTGTAAAGGAGHRAAVVRAIQKELRRVGCVASEPTGVWDGPTRTAMATFVTRMNANLPTGEPDDILLTLLIGHKETACGAECPAGHARAASGTCLPRAIVASGAGRTALAAKAGKGAKPLAERQQLADAEPVSRALDRVRTPVKVPATRGPLAQAVPASTLAQDTAAGGLRSEPLPGRMAVGARVDNAGVGASLPTAPVLAPTANGGQPDLRAGPDPVTTQRPPGPGRVEAKAAGAGGLMVPSAATVTREAVAPGVAVQPGPAVLERPGPAARPPLPSGHVRRQVDMPVAYRPPPPRWRREVVFSRVQTYAP